MRSARLGLAVLALSAAGMVGSSSPADAMCNPKRVPLSVPGGGAAEDTRTGTSATCDWDGIYLGRISDTAIDG
jgi:hypothetical protein